MLPMTEHSQLDGKKVSCLFQTKFNTQGVERVKGMIFISCNKKKYIQAFFKF